MRCAVINRASQARPRIPGEDDVGEPTAAEEDPAEPHGRRPGDGEDDAQGDAEAVVEPTCDKG